MKVSISSLMFSLRDLDKIFDIAGNDVGVEIFPLWHLDGFEEFLKNNVNKLKNLTTSFHEPYFFTEHSAKKGTEKYNETVSNCIKTFEWAQRLNADLIVFHHNNEIISNKEAMIKYAQENLCEMNNFAKKYGLEIVVENAGVIQKNNMLFNEDEFICLFDIISNNCLLDIGHVNCNSWNLNEVVKRLSKKIISYHIHNNDGTNDLHRPIFEGSIDMDGFLSLYREYTPDARLVLEYESNINDVSHVKDDIEWIFREL